LCASSCLTLGAAVGAAAAARVCVRTLLSTLRSLPTACPVPPRCATVVDAILSTAGVRWQSPRAFALSSVPGRFENLGARRSYSLSTLVRGLLQGERPLSSLCIRHAASSDILGAEIVFVHPLSVRIQIHSVGNMHGPIPSSLPAACNGGTVSRFDARLLITS
jgi:hypothetical protein